MTEKIVVTEEMHLEKEWFKEATKQTVETLPAFINHLMGDYEHDYGTVVHAISACAIAAAWAADSTPEGGITGFQAGFVMWDFISQWSKPNNKCGLKLVDYDDFIYPQCAYKYEKTLRANVWESIKKEAQSRLDEVIKGYPNEHAHPDVIAHWKSIVDGKIPFGYSLEANES